LARTTLCELIGLPVLDADGARIGRLRDLAVTLGPDGPPVTSIRASDRGGERVFPWSSVDRLAGGAVRLNRDARPDATGRVPDELLLARDVLDRQVFDAGGKRVTRVGDVLLSLDRTGIRVLGVETGAAALLRRLGLGPLAARLDRRVVDWSDLHLLSARGHALQLASPAAVVHRLDVNGLTELAHRAPHRRTAALLAALPAERARRLRAALAARRPRRRSSDPLSVRKRAPS
jgi:sporulation protein YlmC with PRC-barrel domain